MPEIVTVQVGSLANHVGTHWWNLQEASFVFTPEEAAADETRHDHSLLWRQGRNARGHSTLTPRLVAVDLKGHVGGADLSWAAYGDPAPQGDEEVAGGLKTERLDKPGPSNAFLRDLHAEQKSGRLHSSTQTSLKGKAYALDDAVRSWTDFVRPPFHPRSVLPLPDCEAFGKWSEGEEAAAVAADDLEDRFRRYAEEADGRLAFQLLFDAHDGFAAVAAAAAHHLRQEFPNAALLALPLYPFKRFTYPVDRSHVAYNTAKWLHSLLETQAVILPLSLQQRPWDWPASGQTVHFPLIQPKQELAYHSSAVLAAALETGSGGWRTRKDPDSLPQALAHLTCRGQRIVSLSALLPLQPTTKANFLPQSLSPHCELGELDEEAVLRWTFRGLGPSDDVRRWLGERSRGPSLHELKARLKTPPPFPQSVFRAGVGRTGLAAKGAEGPVEELSAAAVLGTSAGAPGVLGQAFRALDGRKVAGKELNVDRDELRDLGNQLHAQLAQHFPASL